MTAPYQVLQKSIWAENNLLSTYLGVILSAVMWVESWAFNWSRNELFVLCHLCRNFFQAQALWNSWTPCLSQDRHHPVCFPVTQLSVPSCLTGILLEVPFYLPTLKQMWPCLPRVPAEMCGDMGEIPLTQRTLVSRLRNKQGINHYLEWVTWIDNSMALITGHVLVFWLLPCCRCCKWSFEES